MSIVTNNELLAINDCLVKLSNKTVPYTVFYAIAKNLKRIKNDIDSIHETLNKLIKESVQLDEKGNPIPTETGGFKLLENKIAFFYEENKKITESKVEIDFYKVDVCNLEKLNLEAALISPLLDIIFIDKEKIEKKEEDK